MLHQGLADLQMERRHHQWAVPGAVGVRLHRQHDRPLRHEPLRPACFSPRLSSKRSTDGSGACAHPSWSGCGDVVCRHGRGLRAGSRRLSALSATGCEESCCRTRFHHHTLLEYHCLRDGFERLPAGRAGGKSWPGPSPGVAGNTPGTWPSDCHEPLCPLNSAGRCVLYAHRPMICRLHGIPHELRRPGQPAQLGPGCGEFHRRCGRAVYHPFDRTPLYTELARLESEFQQALGRAPAGSSTTIAEMLLNDRLAAVKQLDADTISRSFRASVIRARRDRSVSAATRASAASTAAAAT
ncbi:MAG: hypothetical protein MZU95_01040 [Desulfomicrobium escambiense]|nr:hypothetical protein [Desulfomicrobium escambiense]